MNILSITSEYTSVFLHTETCTTDKKSLFFKVYNSSKEVIFFKYSILVEKNVHIFKSLNSFAGGGSHIGSKPQNMFVLGSFLALYLFMPFHSRCLFTFGRHCWLHKAQVCELI